MRAGWQRTGRSGTAGPRRPRARCRLRPRTTLFLHSVWRPTRRAHCQRRTCMGHRDFSTGTPIHLSDSANPRPLRRPMSHASYRSTRAPVVAPLLVGRGAARRRAARRRRGHNGRARCPEQNCPQHCHGRLLAVTRPLLLLKKHSCSWLQNHQNIHGLNTKYGECSLKAMRSARGSAGRRAIWLCLTVGASAAVRAWALTNASAGNTTDSPAETPAGFADGLAQARPVLASVAQPPRGARPTTGGFSVTLMGSGFGAPDATERQIVAAFVHFYGGEATSAAGASAWTSDSSVVVPAPAGVGVGRGVSVLVNGQRSEPCSARGQGSGCTIAYDPPVARRIQPALAPCSGGRRVTLRGTGFGPPPQSLAMDAVDAQAPNSSAPFPAGMLAKIGPTDCLETEWVSQTSAACVTPPGEGVYVDVSIKARALSNCVCVRMYVYLYTRAHTHAHAHAHEHAHTLTRTHARTHL